MTYDKDSFLAGLSVGLSLRYSKRIPAPVNCLTFSSPSSFTLSIYNSTKNWDGTIEVSTNRITWAVWDGTTTITAALGSGYYYLYVRGSGNTLITGQNGSVSGGKHRWMLGGSNISCDGDIRTLLDYLDPENTTMALYCFQYLFGKNSSLIKAPSLPAVNLSPHCYELMFYGCSKLTVAPELSATTMTSNCYYGMFEQCSSLVSAPALPATTLADHCYEYMFYDCRSLISPPSLPATELAPYCYADMFLGCISLVTTPTLHATTLANYCYAHMFEFCNSLVSVSNLPATTLKPSCYQSMFASCVSLKTLPILAATMMEDKCYRSMFSGCESIKISETQTGEYQTPYRIPAFENGVDATDAVRSMFSYTGGSFADTPNLNTTYYTSNMVIS